MRVVACGPYGGAISEQAKFVNALAPLCDAVVGNTACVAAEDEPDSVWQERVQELLEKTGSAPLGLYEAGDQPDKAAAIYIRTKNWAAAAPLMARISSPKLHGEFAKAKEAEAASAA